MHQQQHYLGPKREERKKVPKKIFEEIIMENFPNKGKGHPSTGNSVSSRQDKLLFFFFGSPSHNNQRRKRNKRNWQRKSKTFTVFRRHDALHRKP